MFAISPDNEFIPVFSGNRECGSEQTVSDNDMPQIVNECCAARPFPSEGFLPGLAMGHVERGNRLTIQDGTPIELERGPLFKGCHEATYRDDRRIIMRAAVIDVRVEHYQHPGTRRRESITPLAH